MDFRLTDAVIKMQVKGRAVVSHCLSTQNRLLFLLIMLSGVCMLTTVLTGTESSFEYKDKSVRN